MRFIKAHAYGNDFLILPVDEAIPPERPELVRRLCDRHRGVGADGVLFIDLATVPTMTLVNADGSPSELSGNGLRCVAAWLADRRRLTAGDVVEVLTEAGQKSLTLLESRDRAYRFRAAMGQPEQIRRERIPVGGQTVDAVVLRVGNPQCVVLGPATPDRLRTIAGPLAVDPFFPEGTNVELVDVESATRLRILIWERGVGPTEASGTGACAAAVAAAAYGGAARDVEVVSPGGAQRVEWTDEGLWLTGWAALIAEGDWIG